MAKKSICAFFFIIVFVIHAMEEEPCCEVLEEPDSSVCRYYPYCARNALNTRYPFPFCSLIDQIKEVPFCEDLNAPNISAYRFDPDFDRNVTYLIISKGYPEEEHCVVTKDGYKLSMQRIPGGRGENGKKEGKKVVFLLHGLFSCSSQFVFDFPNQSLGFLLADAGYDVWLGNNRGNTYSRCHVKLSPDSTKFWDFSFDEFAKYDIPAMIDYILNVTGQTQVYFIGHSTGSTAAVALLSESPEYNAKIRFLICMAPAVYLTYTKGLFAELSPLAPLGHILFYHFGVTELLPQSAGVKLFARYVCGRNFQKGICETIVTEFFGKDCQMFNTTRLGVYVCEVPSGVSLKSVVHFSQEYDAGGKFQKYDYGPIENMKIYNQSSPPEYNVTRITVPTAIFSGKNDFIVQPENAQLLACKLRYLVGNYVVPFPKFNHLDFAIGLHANKLVYCHILEMLKKH